MVTIMQQQLILVPLKGKFLVGVEEIGLRAIGDTKHTVTHRVLWLCVYLFILGN